KAFNQMRRRGLIAECECYCEHCGQHKMLAAQRGSERPGDGRGFVHLAELDQVPTLEQVRVPLVFGLVTGDTVTYREPACISVGEVVAECLRERDISYEWDRVLGSPILVVAEALDQLLPGWWLREHAEGGHETATAEFHLPIFKQGDDLNQHLREE